MTGEVAAAASAPGGPAPTASPTVLGSAAAGKRLTGLSGTWIGSGTISYGFQWHRCDAAGARCTSIHGAVSPTYLLVDKDVGKTIGLTVTASDGTGPVSAYASLVGPIASATPLLVSTGQPTVSGPPLQAKTVQVSTGVWSPTPSKVTYSWERCNANGRVCATIANATGNSYTLGAADVGHALLASVQASFGPTTATVFSTATPAAVSAGVIGPTLVASPSVSGSLTVAAQVSGSVGLWTGAGALAYHFQWYRCDTSGGACISIHGATKSTYRLVAKDAGSTIGLTVTASDATGQTSGYANLVGPTAPSPSPLTSTAQPTVTGTPHPGETLTVSNGTWAPAPETVTYAWKRCNANGRLCATIAGATGLSYVATMADVGHALLAVVQATVGTNTQAALSAATHAVS